MLFGIPHIFSKLGRSHFPNQIISSLQVDSMIGNDTVLGYIALDMFFKAFSHPFNSLSMNSTMAVPGQPYPYTRP